MATTLYIANEDEVREIELIDTMTLIQMIDFYQANADATLVFPTLDGDVAEYPLSIIRRWSNTIMQCGWCLLTNFTAAREEPSA